MARYPGLSWHVPGTHAYLIAGPWRNRGDIIEVYESRGERHRQGLWDALLARDAGRYSAVVIDPTEYRSAAPFYRGAGVESLEEMIVLRTSSLPGPPIDITLEMAPLRLRGLAELLEVDHDAFPWLWWNSREEFEEYLETPGVKLWVGLEDGQAIGYVGYTDLGGWGHIDRLAVRKIVQGRGYGAQLLSWTLRQLQGTGSRYVQLSTQGTNDRSQTLYNRFGFRQTRGNYRLYGKFLGEGPSSGDG